MKQLPGLIRIAGRGLLGIALTLYVMTSESAVAQEAGSHWQFYITPYIWLAGTSGTASTPNPNLPSQSVDAGFGDILSHLDAIPVMGAGEAATAASEFGWI